MSSASAFPPAVPAAPPRALPKGPPAKDPAVPPITVPAIGNINDASSPIRFPKSAVLPLFAPFLKSFPASFAPFFISFPSFEKTTTTLFVITNGCHIIFCFLRPFFKTRHTTRIWFST
jgi:hypothetical protein